MTIRFARTLGLRVGLAGLVVAVSLSIAAQERAPSQPRRFGADYDGLNDAQRALVDDIYRRLSEILGQTYDPKTAYNETALSVRTTFDAVTNALASSTFTDRGSGESLGTPLDLIDYLETVEGQVKGAPGDQQFRLYAALKPGAVDRLTRSSEFRRTTDNTIFHKGYPISYRQDGYPSVQFSISRDGTRADIDVDYRSSRFPVALVNGHLTAANSDVRAGNYERHTGRWSGLVNWWEGFVSVLFSARTYDVPDDRRAFPVAPRAGDKTIDIALDDFLTSWLVEGLPNLAVAYVDSEAFECLALRLEQDGQELDRGLARFQMYVRMKVVSDALGPRQSLDGTTIGIRLTDPNLKLVDHRRRGQYAIYGVPRVLADRMTCDSYSTLGVLPQADINRFQKEAIESFYSTFLVVGPEGQQVPLGLLWQKRDGIWKIVSYQGAPDTGTDPGMPDVRPAAEPVAVPRIAGDPDFIAANERFLDAWLVDKRVDDAFAYFSPSGYACVNLYLDPGEPAATTAEEQRARLHAGMERVAQRVGRVGRLEDVIQGVEPADPRVRVVEHGREAAIGLFALPDWAGPAAECETRLARGDALAVEPEGAAQAYGRYYASVLQFRTLAGETAVLYLGWRREQDRWQIFSFKVIEP